MDFARRCFVTTIAALISASAFAQAVVKPFVVYDDELKNVWQNWSWAKVQLSMPISNAKPIKVQGDAWSALQLHHEPFSIEGLSKLTFYISGGAEAGQQLKVALSSGGKAIDSTYMIAPKAKTWAVVEVPLKELNAAGKMIDGVLLQGGADAYKPYYITRIQFE